MSKLIGTSSEIIRFSSDDQNIWAPGEAKQFTWHEYIALIGGERSYFTVSDLTLVQGEGKLTVDGDRIFYDSEGAYEDLASGQTVEIIVDYVLVADDGTELDRSVTIEGRSIGIGTGFTIPETGDTAYDIISFAAADADTILDDPHVFDTMTIIDIDFDTDEALEAALTGLDTGLEGALSNLARAEASRDEARDAHEAAKAAAQPFDDFTALTIEFGLDLAAAETAEFVYDAAKTATEAVESAELDELAKKATYVAAKATFDGLEVSLNVAEAATVAAANAVSTAVSALSSVTSKIWDLIPSWFTGALAAAAKFLGLDDDLERAGAVLDRARDTLTNKEAIEASIRSDFNAAQSALDRAEDDFNEATQKVIDKTSELADILAGKTLEGLKAAKDATAAELAKTEDELADATQIVVDITGSTDPLKIAAKGAELKAAEVAAFAELGLATADVTAAIVAVEAIEVAQLGAEALMAGTDLSMTIQQEAQIEAQLGFQIDFKLDAGSVDTDIDLQLDTDVYFDQASDTLTFMADATNATTGESIAFETQGPSFNLYAGFVFDFKATLSSVMDAYAKLGSFELFDFPTTAQPLTSELELQFSDWIDILDFDNTTLSHTFDWPFGADWLDKILQITVAAPVIETQGYAVEPSLDLFTDPTGFSYDEFERLLSDFTGMELGFSDEFLALLEQNAAEHELELSVDELGDAFALVARALWDSIGEDADLNGDGFVPLFLASGADSGVDGLLHINNIDDTLPENIDDVGTYGLFYAQGQSNDVLRVTIDLDQLAATLINVAFGNPPATTINPLGMSISLDDLLNKKDDDTKDDSSSNSDSSDGDGKTEEENKTGLQRYFDFEAGYDILDIDVTAGLNFSQKFALDFHDLELMVTFEDDTVFTFDPQDDLVIANASDLVDTDGNGQIDYEMTLTPSSTFYNDTQLGLTLGYQIDVLQAFAEASLGLPFDLLFEDLDWKLPLLSKRLSFGPVLSVEADVDAVSMDIFEDSFAFDIGLGHTSGVLPLLNGLVEEVTSSDPTDGPDLLLGDLVKNDLLYGGGGDDTIFGFGGADLLDGGDDDDLMFGDALPLSAFDDTAAQVYRLYQATLDRAPDVNGMQNWATRLATGEMTMVEAAKGFVNSAEFALTYGDLGTADFVTLLYENVLDRAPDLTGLLRWVGDLEGGLSRADVIVGFANSLEFKLDTEAEASSFAADLTQHSWTDDVFRLYQAALDRAPNLEGLFNWADRLATGTDYLSVVNGFVGSQEFKNRFGEELGNGAFVELLYQNVLNRGADASGLARWVGDLEAGASRAEVLQGFAQSSEFRINTTQTLEDWMRDYATGDDMIGGAGNDKMSGGFGADIFIFRQEDAGRDTVLDLEAWDTIDIRDFDFDDLDTAQAAFTQVGADVEFASGDVEVVFKSTSLTIIDQDMLLI